MRVQVLKACLSMALFGAGAACAQGSNGTPAMSAADAAVVDAREAWRRNDRARLAALRDQLAQTAHPLAPWADYWELSSRLPQATIEEVESFYARWPATYVEDRLRNDWLLELGRRRDWAAFARDQPRFRMNDDREVQCYGLLIEAQAGRDVREAALAAWFGQREADDGCQLLATQLHASGQIGAPEIWRRLRWAAEHGRLRVARATAGLLGPGVAKAVEALFDSPARFLARPPAGERDHAAPLAALAVIRMASNDPAAAARHLEAPWAGALRPEAAAGAWGALARQAALKHMPEAAEWGETALRLDPRPRSRLGLSDDTLGWIVRAQLRAFDAAAWTQIGLAIDAMSEGERAEPVWSYWRARALLARARAGSAGDAAIAEARALLQRIASPMHFYGQLALEELGQPPTPPPEPAALSAAERDEAAGQPGLRRALLLVDLGLRNEGVREWNFTLIGMDDRRLQAAAQLACERQVWDRCIGASERTRQEINLAQRYPMPFRDEIAAAGAQAGVAPALVYGLIRQESRFVTQARSHAGASGLMQVMPATARWTARRLGLDWRPEWREDRVMNLRLGTNYLRLVVDEFGGSLPMAMAAYNAGPSRPRRWREGAVVEAAAWAETIPVHETRDYVKKVLSNASLYAQRLGSNPGASLKSWLGPAIGPRPPDAPEPNKELP